MYVTSIVSTCTWSHEGDPSACSEPEFGHGILTVMDANTAKWEWHRTMDVGPVVTDSVIITRDGARCPCVPSASHV